MSAHTSRISRNPKGGRGGVLSLEGTTSARVRACVCVRVRVRVCVCVYSVVSDSL